MFRKIVIAVALLAMAGVASAAGSRDSGECFRFFGFELFCLPAWNPDPGSKPLRAPEIDPACTQMPGPPAPPAAATFPFSKT